MNFSELKKFITQDMSMSHIYQPVMLIELLNNQGKEKAKAKQLEEFARAMEFEQQNNRVKAK